MVSVPSNCTCRTCLWCEAAVSPGEGALLRLASTGGSPEGVREGAREGLCVGWAGCESCEARAVSGAAAAAREVAPGRTPEEVRLNMGDLR